VYFGDAANRPWPWDERKVERITTYREGLEIRLQPAILSVVVLRGRSWARAAVEGHVAMTPSSSFRGSIDCAVFPSLRPNEALLLVRGHSSQTVTAGIRKLAEPPERITPGRRLRAALHELRSLSRLQAFAECLDGAERELEDILVTIEQAADSRRRGVPDAPLEEKLIAAEAEAASAYDESILTAALIRAQKPWDYAADSLAYWAKQPQPASCILCRGVATISYLRTYGTYPVDRRQLLCPRCFVVYNVPKWQLTVRAVSLPTRAGRTIQATFRFKNRGSYPRRLAVALHVDGTYRVHRRPRAVINDLAPGCAVDATLRFTARTEPDNFRRTKLFLVSEGAFGFYSYARFL
jgi:hypothetical protein